MFVLCKAVTLIVPGSYNLYSVTNAMTFLFFPYVLLPANAQCRRGAAMHAKFFHFQNVMITYERSTFLSGK